MDFSDLRDVVTHLLKNPQEMEMRQQVRFNAVKPFMNGYEAALNEETVFQTFETLVHSMQQKSKSRHYHD